MRLTESNNARGATPDEWFHFDFVLGLGANLLPCVPAAPEVRVLAGSALEGKVGKIPSQFNRAGEAHGLKDWQKREILGNEVVAWSKDPRLNLCVRLGAKSGVYAIDVDIDDDETARRVRLALDFDKYGIARRARANSAKFLVPFRLEGGSCKKRIIKTEHGRIELLADGQQFVAAGSHSSGVRYQWLPGLPETIPTITMEKMNQIWEMLTQTFAIPSTIPKTPTAEATAAQITDSSSLTSTSAGTNTNADINISPRTTISESEWTDLLNALRFLLPHAADNDTWSEIGYALLSLRTLRKASGQTEDAPTRRLWIDFSRKAPGWTEGAPEQWWETHHAQTPRTDYRHIFTMARQRGMARVADPASFPVVESSGDVGSAATQEPASDAAGGEISVVPDAPTHAIIELSDSRYSEIIEQIEDLLVPEVYVQGPHLVRRSEAHDDGEIHRSSDGMMLILVTREWMKKRLGEIAVWNKFLKTEGRWVETKPSDEHITGVLNLRGWRKLRPLEAIARAPFVRADGSICDEPGYDRRSRVLYVPGAEFPAIPTAPDQREAFEALERIRGVFDQFPWKERASESAFLSHILTEAARLAIDCSPVFFYDAPAPATGKTILQGMAARIVHGTVPAQRAWVGDHDEIRKVLYAALLAGDRSIWFDNIPKGLKIRSPELEGFVTSETWTDRKLGESSSLGIPNKMVVVGSGNNITPTGDLARRSLVVRLDANMEDLSQRVFKIPDLKPYVMEHRPQMLIDALTIIKAYNILAEPSIEMPRRISSFEQWSRFCREPLIWLGLPDPVITQKHETDDDSQSIGVIFETLYERFADHPFTSMDVARLVNGITDSTGELAGVLIQNGCQEPNSPIKVGYWLRGFRDRIGKGVKLVNAGNSKVGVRWRFQRIGQELIGG
jgi:Primase C terminal 2 (PriCT-2)